MKVHFIAVGGSAMHNLAIALHRKGIEVSGSDDEIFEPSASRLKKEGIFPTSIGWDENVIHSGIDAVILGMHARADNPELLKAKELGIHVYSYPEYLYEQSKNKTRIVIGGSHGKTTITSMLLHAFSLLGIESDYMVGAQLEGYDCMVKITDNAPIIVLEGDEYLSSPIDRRPKFHLYHPHIALISGIAWDHINVFPTFENYINQFDVFCTKIEPNGILIYNDEDLEVKKLILKFKDTLKLRAYKTPLFKSSEKETVISFEDREYVLSIFGSHNLQNLVGAMKIANEVGISSVDFLEVMQTFKGAGKRLELVVEKQQFAMYKDFAHSPSKLRATTKAIREKYKDRTIVACMELHTFSSLNKDFLPLYDGTMNEVDHAIVYFNPSVIEHKKLSPLSIEMVARSFGDNVSVLTKTEEVLSFLQSINQWNNHVLLMMSSGNFDGIDYAKLGSEISFKLN